MIPRKTVSIALLSLFFAQATLAQRITGIYTDFNYQNRGYWYANGNTTADNPDPGPSPNMPSNSHHLLAFTWNGTTYTTGVDDALLDSKIPDNSFIKKSYRSFPVAYLPSPGSSTYVGVGYNYGGPGPVSLANNSMEYYLTDGIRGFDLGTGIYNLPKTGSGTTFQPSKYTVSKITTGGIYNQPVVVISQMGNPGGEDFFYFVDENGAIVGNKKSVSFDSIGGVGRGHFKFYKINSNGLAFTDSPNGTRLLRFIAYSLADFGIDTEEKVNQVKQFWQELSGSSDQAFIGAYNTEVMEIAQSVSGFVYKDGGNTHKSPGYAGATVTLYKSDGTTVVATATTNAGGYYLFGDVPKGNYIISITVPLKQKISIASDNNNDADILITVGEEPVTGTYFSLEQSLPVHFGPVLANIYGGQLFVKWTTLNEINNSHFEIEVSKDGKTFLTAGKVSSSAIEGNSDTPINYEYAADINNTMGLLGLSVFSIALAALFMSRRNKALHILFLLIGISLFTASCTKNDRNRIGYDSDIFVRIKQVDKDGSYEYSKVVKVVRE
ncbi:MAG: SdrD B-like domain-containing protein [Niabella sp.]